MYGMIFGFLLVLVLAPLLSYPPTLPGIVISLYDYPIIRLLSLSVIVLTAYIMPEIAIILGIAYAILSEDIMKTTGKLGDTGESFQTMLNLVPQETDVNDARHINSQTTKSLDNVMTMVKKLETELHDMSRLYVNRD